MADAWVMALLGEGAADRPADPAVLDDALLAALSDLEPPVEPKLKPKPERTRPKQPDWRRKYREEIARLRVEAAALAKTLATLRGAARSRLAAERGDGAPPSAAELWRKVADGQQEGRELVERENGRLRGLVKQRQKEMRELRRALLLKKANAQVIGPKLKLLDMEVWLTSMGMTRVSAVCLGCQLRSRAWRPIQRTTLECLTPSEGQWTRCTRSWRRCSPGPASPTCDARTALCRPA